MKTRLWQRLGATSVALMLCCIVAVAIAKATTPSSDAMPTLPTKHHIVIQVSENDPAVMNLALNNIVNLENYYASSGKTVQIELVAYGPGLTMLREDTSPVKARIQQIKASIPDVTFSACNVTLHTMEKAEGKKIAIVPQARMVPTGVGRIVTLEEQGWSYIKP